MKAIQGLVITPEGKLTVVTVRKLEDMQDHVGGYIEEGVEWSRGMIYVNEEGLLRGLKLNQLASVIAGRYLVGNALVLGPTDEAGESTGLPTSDMILIKQIRRTI